jgi:integrase
MTNYLNKAVKLNQSERTTILNKFKKIYKGILTATTFKIYFETLILLISNDIDIKTKSRYLQVKAVISKLHDIDLLKDVTLLKFTKRQGNKEKRVIQEKYINEETFLKLMDYTPKTAKGQELKLACEVSYYSGLRAKEVLSLKAKDINILDGGGIEIVVWHGKGDKFRRAYLPKSFAERLSGFEGFKITLPYLETTLSRTIKKYNKNNLESPVETTFHGFRHSFCTNILKEGVSLEKVRDLAGHSDISITSRYIHSEKGITDEMKAIGY